MYGRDATHNGVVLKGAPPTDWQVGEFDRKSGAWHREKSRNVKWVANLGRVTFGDPVVAGGLVWVGTNNGHGQNIEDASVLACFRESDGKLLYRYLSPRLPGGLRHDWPLSSMACSPLIEGDRMWFTTNRCETVCLDIGPLKRGESPPRELWKVDLMQQFGVRPCGLARYMGRASSVVAYRDLIYVITGNGMDGYSAAITAPEAPSVICFQKESGEVLWKDHSPGAIILTGQRGSPLVIDAGDRAQVVVPQGDGWLRSFEPLTGKLLWKFDINFKTSEFEAGGRGTRNDINATPVYYGGRIYVASGQLAEYGEGDGRLICIDPSKTGDISSELAVDAAGQMLPDNRLQAVDPAKGQRAIPNTNSGLVWEYTKADHNGDGKFGFEEKFHRTNGNVAIKENLLVVVDSSGLMHCLDAETGKVYWAFDTFSNFNFGGSPLIVGDKVYVADDDGDVLVFSLSADPKAALRNKLKDPSENNVGESIHCSPVFANDTLYIASQSHLIAIASDNPAGPAAGGGVDWPVYGRDATRMPCWVTSREGVEGSRRTARGRGGGGSTSQREPLHPLDQLGLPL